MKTKIVSLLIALIIAVLGVVPAFAEDAVETPPAETTYKLSFEVGEAKKLDAKEYKENDAIVLPAVEEASNDMYQLCGWYSDSEFKTAFALEKMPANDVTAYGDYAIKLSAIKPYLEANLGEFSFDAVTKDMSDAEKQIASSLFALIKIKVSVNGGEPVEAGLDNIADKIVEVASKTAEKSVCTVKIEIAASGIFEDYVKSLDATSAEFPVYNDVPAAPEKDADKDKEENTDKKEEEKPAFEVTGASLLTEDQWKTLSESIRVYEDAYWLKDASENNPYVVTGLSKGGVGKSSSNLEKYVRPTLSIKNTKESGHKVGDKFTFGGKEFVIIDDNTAFCLGDIGKHVFRQDSLATDANKYEASDLVRFVDEWYNTNSGKGFEFVKVNDDKENEKPADDNKKDVDNKDADEKVVDDNGSKVVTDIPKTGSNFVIPAVLGALIVAAGITIFFTRKKKDDKTAE